MCSPDDLVQFVVAANIINQSEFRILSKVNLITEANRSINYINKNCEKYLTLQLKNFRACTATWHILDNHGMLHDEYGINLVDPNNLESTYRQLINLLSAVNVVYPLFPPCI